MTCEYCHTFPHLPGCPWETERYIYQCRHCGEGIAEGAEFYDIDGEYYHVECLEEMGVTKILCLLGIEIETA